MMDQTNLKKKIEHFRCARGAWQDHALFGAKYLVKNGSIFLHDSVFIVLEIIKINFINFAEHVRESKRAWQGHDHYSFMAKKEKQCSIFE